AHSGVPQTGGLGGEDRAVPIELVELGCEVCRKGGDHMDAAAIGGVTQGRGELGDPTEEPLFLRMEEEPRLPRTRFACLRQDAAGTRVRVLQERGGVTFEV